MLSQSNVERRLTDLELLTVEGAILYGSVGVGDVMSISYTTADVALQVLSELVSLGYLVPKEDDIHKCDNPDCKHQGEIDGYTFSGKFPPNHDEWTPDRTQRAIDSNVEAAHLCFALGMNLIDDIDTVTSYDNQDRMDERRRAD